MQTYVALLPESRGGWMSGCLCNLPLAGRYFVRRQRVRSLPFRNGQICDIRTNCNLTSLRCIAGLDADGLETRHTGRRHSGDFNHFACV